MAFNDVIEQVKEHPKTVAIILFGCLVVGSLGAGLYVNISEQRAGLVDERIARLELDSKNQKKVNQIILSQMSELKSGYERLPESLNRIKGELAFVASIESLDPVRKKDISALVETLAGDMRAVETALEKSEAILSTFDNFLKASLAENKGLFSQALTAYLIAAKKGNADAQYRLATLYARGAGVEQDLNIASMWYQKAALAGNTGARAELAQLYASGNGVQLDLESALALYSLIKKDVPVSAEAKIFELKETMSSEQIEESLEIMKRYLSENEALPKE